MGQTNQTLLEEDQQGNSDIQAKYRYWRIRIFYSTFLGYAIYYFTRKSFTFAMPAMIQSEGFSKSELGLLASILSLSYGFSKFFSGILSDHANPRYFFSCGLIVTGILNIFFGLSSSILFFAIFWGLNGWFQGFGWPPVAKYLTHWYAQSERGRWWAAWNTSHNVGGALVPLVAALCAQSFGWRYAMFVPGMIAIIVGLFLINRLRSTPEDLGLPPIEKFKGEELPDQVAESSLSSRELLVRYVLGNLWIWLLGISYFLIYIVRTGINDWSAVYLVEAQGYSQLEAGKSVCAFEVGGFIGSLAAGWASDKLFHGRRGPVNVLFSAFLVIAVLGFSFSLLGNGAGTLVCLFAIGGLVFGPQMLIGMAAAELSHKKAVGAATGFVGCFAYVGAAVAGYPLGRLIEDFGWNAFFMAMVMCAALGTLVLTPLWSATKPKWLWTPSKKEVVV